jgi:Dyp-type peroxidase family
VTVLDLRDLQGNVVRGYNLTHARYLFLRFTSPGAPARQWLGDLLPTITTATEFPLPHVATNVAFTHGGLRHLGLHEAALASFPEEFRDGMRARAELVLGDRGHSAPCTWEEGPGRSDVDVLVVLQSLDEDALDRPAEDLRAADGLALVKDQPAATLVNRKVKCEQSTEHFGFADGISQPSIRGAPPQTAYGLAPGEFLLGHPDEAGDVADTPRPAALARNGSYLVYRKLAQDVRAFRRFLRSAGDQCSQELLAAKLVGRWRTGAPLVLHPQVDPGWRGVTEGSAHLNTFDYATDPDGHRCPLGAHIRRANPREEEGGSGARSVRHALLRRGMPYGPELPEGADHDGEERGLVFVAYCADLQRQFEFVQSQWLNDGDAFGLGHSADPIAGTHEGTRFVVQGDPPRLHGLAPFVRTRGGAYLFQPGLSALELLADGAFTGPAPRWNQP